LQVFFSEQDFDNIQKCGFKWVQENKTFGGLIEFDKFHKDFRSPSHKYKKSKVVKMECVCCDFNWICEVEPEVELNCGWCLSCDTTLFDVKVVKVRKQHPPKNYDHHGNRILINEVPVVVVKSMTLKQLVQEFHQLHGTSRDVAITSI